MKKFFLILFEIAAGFVVITTSLVVVFKIIPIPVTPLMVIRVFDGFIDGKTIGIDKDWVSYDYISKNFIRAVVAAEDARFITHNGIDWKAVEVAQKYNARNKGKRLHGASTISMQTAKNTFLWHGRNWIRKSLEVYYTMLIEAIWGKTRILEVYVNVIEFGEGIYGVEAASQAFFNKSASDLTKKQAALLAAVLPNPRKWSPARPTNYISNRADKIMNRMNGVIIPKS